MSQKQRDLLELGRLEYLQALVTEFQITESPGIRQPSPFQLLLSSRKCCLYIAEAKKQILANLANFAYDPKNYEYLRQLQVLDLFLDMLTEDNEILVEFAIGGLCNLCLDKTNKDYILEADGVAPVINCLSSSNEETVMSAVTTLMYLTTPQSRQQTTALPVVECMLRFSLSANRRLSNLARVFLEDYCSPVQVEEARNLSKHTAVGIPLPKD
nr:armadillo repeat-containing protein 7 isoform X1 [Chelonoidis abingdonii]XP_032648844.1 armadillo repeat-containing protein 7 isoform X1 [Chelonoidis abingdonii]XP_032648845.1 armadillo repeat-containing protein 7 isoform X1 [Chelonoidis abingdonii]XP_032648846.1 armadillo repeat-containing protein 7 isoform X1 [Chelonoidis abingdonii]